MFGYVHVSIDFIQILQGYFTGIGAIIKLSSATGGTLKNMGKYIMGIH